MHVPLYTDVRAIHVIHICNTFIWVCLSTQIERCPDIKYGTNTTSEGAEFSSNFALLVVTVGSWYHTVLLRSEGIGMRCSHMCNCTQSHPFYIACKGQGRVPRSSILCASNDTLVIVLCWGMGLF